MAKLAVLVSGAGTIFEAMLQAGLEVDLVLSDRPCRGLDLAREAGIPAVLVKRTFGQDFDRLDFTHRVVEVLKSHAIDFVAMAGYMTILEKPMFDAYDQRILNTHPSLLPAFKGDQAVQDALDYGVKVTGCTIHIATLTLDSGPILAQQAVLVHTGDTRETLQERIKQVERVLYPATIKQLLASQPRIIKT